MGYWQEVKEVLSRGVDLAKEGIKGGAETVVHKTREGAESVVKKTREGVSYAQLKPKLSLKHKEYRNILADLGDATHDIYKEKKDIYADENIKKIMDRVIEIENETKKIADEMKSSGEKQKEKPR